MEINQNEFRAIEGEQTYQPRIRLVLSISWILIIIGAISLVISIIFVSQIIAFIGLGLLFWGVILLYIKPEDYTKQVILEAAMPPTIETLDQIINELGYRGKVIYLPPKYFKNPGTYKAYLPKRPEKKLPEPKFLLNHENQLFLKTPESILFTPSGAQLTKLFEKRLGINFSLVNLEYIKHNLPKLFIDDLEIADNLEIKIKSSKSSIEKKELSPRKIQIIMTNSIFKNTINENQKFSQLYTTIDSPISSAIACTLTKVTKKPVTIENIQSYEDGNTIEITYQIEEHDYTEPFEVPLTEPSQYTKKHISPIPQTVESIISNHTRERLIGLSLILLGSITIIWISQLTLVDVLEWSKDLGFALLVYRTGEPIGLGIGMKFIHYFMIGSVLLISGIVTFLQKQKKLFELFIRPPLFPRLSYLILILAGTSILFWITDLVLYELIVWHKSLIYILFSYGTNEPLGLGIGMKVFYYFVIGLALLLSGTFSYLKRKKNY